MHALRIALLAAVTSNRAKGGASHLIRAITFNTPYFRGKIAYESQRITVQFTARFDAAIRTRFNCARISVRYFYRTCFGSRFSSPRLNPSAITTACNAQATTTHARHQRLERQRHDFSIFRPRNRCGKVHYSALFRDGRARRSARVIRNTRI